MPTTIYTQLEEQQIPLLWFVSGEENKPRGKIPKEVHIYSSTSKPSSGLPVWFYCLVHTHKLALEILKASLKKKNLLLLVLMKGNTLSQKCDYLVPHKFKMCEKREGSSFKRTSFYHILKCCSFINDGKSGASKSKET